MSHLTGAVSLDPSRAEFHLYVAWAALEQGNLGRALEEVEDAIERDPSLGDAYWIRGQLRVRTGQSRDALADLTRALEAEAGAFRGLRRDGRRVRAAAQSSPGGWRLREGA